MDLQQALIENNHLMKQMLSEMKGIKEAISKQDVDTCSAKEALTLLGFANERYLTYFFRSNLLNRRKGGSGYLYFKNECRALAEKIKQGLVFVPPIRSIYSKEHA